ncbi:MAG: tRNA lysidine(34) synthetase TilS [Lentisphaeria bacterium]|nr:tRNA lysidine(34) synthetase TilS [Lentisphaeria bacterium]
MIDISDQVRKFLCCRDFAGCRLLVGFSGGADSTALLLALLAAGAKDVLAVHCHHGLRGADADADAAWCRAFCERRGIAFRLEYLDVPGQRLSGESTEEAGRRLRLALWQRLGADEPTVVFLGHHGDDVMEELIMRLARGANSSGLTGLREERQIGGVQLLRPLLSCRRAEIESWLQGQDVTDWRRDHSNRDRTYRRNAVRHDLMPLFRTIFGEDQGLQQAARVLRMDADYLEMAARDAYGQMRDLRDWQALHPALMQRVLRIWLDEHAGPGIIPGAALVARLQDACESQRERGGTRYLSVRKGLAIAVSDAGLAVANPMALPVMSGCAEGANAGSGAVFCSDWDWCREATFLCANGMVLEATLLKASDVWTTPTGTNEEFFAATALPAVLTVRAWQAGDRMQPFASNHRKKLQDIFTDAKIGREERRCWPVICAGDEIIWLPGLRRAEFGRVDEQAGEVVRFRCIAQHGC